MEQSTATTTSVTDNNPQLIFMWKAPLRPYKKRGRNILRFYIALALLLSLLVFFFGDRIMIIPIWTILFLFYVLTITPPPEVENRITKFGLETAGMVIRWEMLSHFYFSKRFGYEVVTVVSHEPYFLHAYMVVPNEEIKKRLISILGQHLIYREEVGKTIIDRLIDLFSKLVPDDDDTIHTTSSLYQKPVPASP